MEKKKETSKYFEAVGRRKTSTARVRIWPSAKASFLVNDKEVRDYFKTEEERRLIQDPLIKVPSKMGQGMKWSVAVHISGGGTHSQAEALRHGLARALVLSEPELRSKLKILGYLKRDPRSKERRKFGLKKARKAPKWSKR